MIIQEAKNRTFLTFLLYTTHHTSHDGSQIYVYPFKGLRAKFPQFLVKAGWDIVAGIESMGGNGECREGR